MKKTDKLMTYTIVTLATAFIINMLIYSGSKPLTANWHHFNMTLPLDEAVPFIPVSLAIYVVSFGFWLLFYLIAALGRSGERGVDLSVEGEIGGYERDRFFAADVLSKFVCFAFFLIVPTTMTRPEIQGTGLWDQAVVLAYMIDTPDGLFPSIHCLVSWFCWIGVRSREDLPPALKWFAFVFAVLICISTVTVKQHVIVDVLGGVILAELCYWLTGFDKVRGLYIRPMKKLMGIFIK